MPSPSPADPRDRLKPAELNTTLLWSAIGFSLLVVFLADFFTPLGIAVWVFYLIPVTLTLWLWTPVVPLLAAAVVTGFILLGFFTDAPGVDPLLAQINRSFGIFTIWMMGIVGYSFIRNRLAVRQQQWVQSVRMGLSEVMEGDQRLEQLGEQILAYLTKRLNGLAGAMYVNREGAFQRIAAHGLPADAGLATKFLPGQGLPGQVVRDNRVLVIEETPASYQWVSTILGKGRPRSLMLAPATVDDTVNAVIELGFVEEIDHAGARELLESVAEAIGIAVRSSDYRASLQNLLAETQRQSEELQVQSEELRVSNEELEEQSRALEESQSRLEQQQVELEQTNVQLEEQAQLLEGQRDELARRQLALEARTQEVQRASRYKSEFLANMSHELRTPLNSTLILARLLAENSSGNLTDDQVRSAETILSSGNDLLTLINDILDLSKIEAGRMEVRSDTVQVEQVLSDIAQIMRPLAKQKGLTFTAESVDGAPETLFTDRQRVDQILKNLLSNAIKFTERGEVKLTVRRAAGERVQLVVKDSGIGISEADQSQIFEAFKQADSASNRKYGGTGLGLSISRQLARLLGGDITVESQPGQGSTFTLSLPLEYAAPLVEPPQDGPVPQAAAAIPLPAPTVPRRPALPARAVTIADDRQQLTGNSRLILIVEDDPTFARILGDLARELEFQFLIATTAEDALILAIQHSPSAVLLDLGLPDHSGLSVLDRMKHDSRTRHIPVHVVSASDQAEAALALGAVGYLLKPVARENLVTALKNLETRLVQRMRRVLVVEDDEVQLSSLQRLLGSHDVETVGVRSAAECLNQLRSETFDCMVLDLSLPDASGYSLLETLSQEDAYSFPPVIVYTGRDLTSEEEHKLRRYSKSIIIKGAKSPERLLDEVTLFLHQVISDLPPEQQNMIRLARSREAALEGRRILIVEDDVRNIFALTSVLEPRGANIQIARNGREALEALDDSLLDATRNIDLVLMDVMMPEMDGLTATSQIRERPQLKSLPIIVLTAKAMRDDQEHCLAAGANDYIAKPLDVDKLLSLIRVWIRK